MEETSKKQTSYRWQPDIANSIIYWSFAWAALFSAITGILETLILPWFSIGLFLIFIILFFLGIRRKMTIEHNQIILHGMFKRNLYQLTDQELMKVSVGKYGLSFMMRDHRVLQILILKKTKRNFLQKLHQMMPNVEIENMPR